METRRTRTRWHFVVLVAAWLLPVGLLALWLWTSPDASGVGTHEQLGLAPCRFRELFGVRCPGCGVTTSVSHFVHGAPLQSLRTQPLGFVVACLAVVLPLAATWRAIRGADLSRDVVFLSRARFVIAMAAVVLGSWLYKLFSV